MDETKSNKKQARYGAKAIKIFFMVFAITLLLQIILLCRERIEYSLDLIKQDFKIALVLNNATAEEAKQFYSAIYFLPEVEEVKILSENDIRAYLRQGNSGLNLQAFLPKGVLPYFYEVRLSKKAFVNPSDWAQNYINPRNEDVQAFFQEKEGALALYLLGLLKTINVVLIAAAFALLAFGFFIESKYLQVSAAERLYAVGISVLAFSGAFGGMFILLSYLNLLPLTPYNPFTIPQIICFLFCLLFGRSLAKWGKF